jgi:hypothetical protein
MCKNWRSRLVLPVLDAPAGHTHGASKTTDVPIRQAIARSRQHIGHRCATLGSCVSLMIELPKCGQMDGSQQSVLPLHHPSVIVPPVFESVLSSRRPALRSSQKWSSQATEYNFPTWKKGCRPSEILGLNAATSLESGHPNLVSPDKHAQPFIFFRQRRALMRRSHCHHPASSPGRSQTSSRASNPPYDGR